MFWPTINPDWLLLQHNIGYVSEQLDCVLLQHIYPLLNSPSFTPPLWADEAIETVGKNGAECIVTLC